MPNHKISLTPVQELTDPANRSVVMALYHSPGGQLLVNYLKWRAEECHQTFLNSTNLDYEQMVTLKERENAYLDILTIPEELDIIKERIEEREQKMKELSA
jgi:tRNA(His) 5'-end guanylyltransferase